MSGGTVYVSKRVEVEALQFAVGPDDYGDPAYSGEYVVRWVNANGGEARYEGPGRTAPGKVSTDPARIAVRTINGWAYAAPGHYVVRGETTFWVQGEKTDENPDGMEVRRDFYPCDPETFERRWEAKS